MLRPFVAVIKCSSDASSEYSVLLWECKLNDGVLVYNGPLTVSELVMRHSFP